MVIEGVPGGGGKGRFGALRRFGGFRGGGAGDWAARVGLRGERGCAGEPVAREGGMCAGPGARRPEAGSGEGPKSREIGPRFFVTEILIDFSDFWKF